MRSRALTNKGAIIAVLLLQLIPLIMLPAESFSLQTQEWWLSVLLTLMVLVADIQLILRRSSASWPWYLVSFAQGFNIISRLMLVWSHATTKVGNVWVPDWGYIALSAASMALSVFALLYMEMPEIRTGLLRKA
jgi:hypothetical protein